MIEQPTPEQTPKCEYAGAICWEGSKLRECMVNQSKISCEHYAQERNWPQSPNIAPKCFMALAHKRYLEEIRKLENKE